EMHLIADFAPGPLFFVDIDGDFGVAAIGATTVTTGNTVREMSPMLHDIQGPAIRTNDALTIRCHISSAGVLWRITQTRYGPPIKASTAPAGSSIGGIATRPSASQNASNAPPRRKEQGIKRR